jgi:hypothetical protein
VITLTSGSMLIFEDPSEAGRLRPDLAVVYPELHSRLTVWWLTHAWRGLELAIDAATAALDWREASAAALARTLLEELAGLVYESRQITIAWQQAKALPNSASRSTEVRRLVGTAVLKAFRGSRMSGFPDALTSPNILTQLSRLEAATAGAPIKSWYEWLSEASHPGLSSRLLYASSQHLHSSGGISMAWYSRLPLDADSIRANNVPQIIAYSIVSCAEWLCDFLPSALRLVDDFGLTTRAPAWTSRQYFRSFSRLSGQPCPCGCGGAIAHSWGKPAPELPLRFEFVE